MSGFEEATAVEYLKTLAVSRMVLDNIENVQADLETQGLKVLQMGLRFGGNDVGSVLLDGSGCHDRRGPAASDSGRGLQAGAAGYAVPNDVLELVRNASNASRSRRIA